MLSSRGNTFTRQKHIPSGIILVWLGKDNKPHTKSIPIGFIPEMTEVNARTELALLQLACMGEEYAINKASHPIITRGLTRQQAKSALLRELGKESNRYERIMENL